MKKIIKTILIIAILTIIGTIGVYKFLTMPVSNNEEKKDIHIPMDSGTVEIARILKENNVIKNELAFRVYVKLNNIKAFSAGNYQISESMDLKEITDLLQTGVMYDPDQITITYIEGKPMWWLAKTIEEKTNNTVDDVYEVLENEEYIDKLIEKYWFLTDEIKNEDIYYPLEGYLFPDTYALADEDATVEEIFEKMLDRMEDILNEYKTEIEESNYSIHEILTLASIVETEGMNDDGRKNVASVFYNRLDMGMSLGSDVTTYYAVKEDMANRDLYQYEIDSDNPYNTRGPNMEGKLPVGPISSISRTSLEAAIQPNSTDYLFFVADKEGTLYFTKTNSEHIQIINELKGKGLWFTY